jgi:hypothetical protein
VAGATFLNLLLTELMALFTNKLSSALGGYLFVMFGAITFLGGAFLIVFMKETRGLTEY